MTTTPLRSALDGAARCLGRLLACAALASIATSAASNAAITRTSFQPSEADPAASLALGEQRAMLQQGGPHQGRLAVFLHGAGVGQSCGPGAHLRELALMGFHVFAPCYVSDYGVENCGDDIGGCRLEAFEGVDHHPFVEIAPPDSIEGRLAAGLRLLAERQPADGWQGYLDADGRPRWDRIVLTGHSHGASTAALIGKVRDVARIVLLAGPYDQGQRWLTDRGKTPAERYFGLTHSADRQHDGHLAAFEALGLPGAPVDVDHAAPPFDHSHRLITGVASGRPHSAVRAGGVSPSVGDRFVLEPVWRYLYGADR